ncbi:MULTISPECIES: CsbD family protein [Acetobacter]|uniref:CsbD family protein n=1 Tax=Acetobacter thailandicus TaxID=1502842 RepID=A0ABT3QF92_9PROT|nr:MULTISPECIES: CsbD family protein [Acetobacter]MBS0960093.1 CsbD family protein [Acetobacter thailandicus]MBS0979422.1 CsbD family protein [Acetobacter thailandicus]MBS0985626.1 CsbD family protein [Acetobacter thailandicus]MBS1002541.1 CsbD family protein [Acetobacter thailandicus]MCX2563957.1 CsbD family protein [Acetobacter thailandicus]
MADDKLKVVANKVEGLATEAKGRAKDAVGGLTGDIGLQAEGKFDQFAGGARQDFADLYEEGEGFVEKATTFVRDKPLLSLGIVSGVALILSWLIFPRKKSS